MHQKGQELDKYSDVEELLFLELFREYEQRLFVFVVKILRSGELARDIVQDVFLKLWAIKARIADIENINGFLYKLAENKVYDYLRKASVEKEVREELWHRINEFTDDHSQTMIDKEYNAVIEKAIHQLSPQRKIIYMLSKREGKKQTQIAELLQISPNTVRNHLAEAFKQIGLYVRQNMNGWLFFL